MPLANLMSGEKKKWKREFSAGGIVYKKEDGRSFVLMILPAASQRMPNPEWTFPKGHVGDKQQETPEQAALREVQEETGIVAEIRKSLGSVKYSYSWDEDNILKIVTWYLMEYVSGDVADHDHEVETAEFLSLDEAAQRVHWSTDKEMFEKVKKIINSEL